MVKSNTPVLEKGRWELLKNQVYCCDCFAFFKNMADGSVDLVLTDPPYGISYQNHFTKKQKKPITGDKALDFLVVAKECYRILKENRHAYFFTRFDSYPLHYQYLAEAGFSIKNCLVIEKANVGGIGDLKGSFANNSEWIIFCQKGRRIFQRTELMKNRYPPGTVFHRGRIPSREYKYRFNSCWFGEAYPKATYNSAWLSKHHIHHPTVKNVECLSWLIQISTLSQELVFDPFMGSGSTALAAEKTNRFYCGCEMEEDYCLLFQRRQQGGDTECRNMNTKPEIKQSAR